MHQVKELPYLSVVQATQGSYSLGLDGSKSTHMKCGACFVAPSFCGIDDLFYFSKLFKKKVGVSPLAYRKSYRAMVYGREGAERRSGQGAV